MPTKPQPSVKNFAQKLRDGLMKGEQIATKIAETKRLKESNTLSLAKPADPADAAAVKAYANAKTLADLFPQQIEQLGNRMGELLLSLAPDADELRRQISYWGGAERSAIIDRYEPLLRPVAAETTELNGEVRKPARLIASNFPIHTVIAEAATPKTAWPDFPRSNDPARWDARAIEHLRELVEITDRWISNHESFVSPGYGQPAAVPA